MSERRTKVRRKEDAIRDWYRWYPQDWKDSERAMVLSLGEQGACRNLYDAMWQRGGKLSANDKLLWQYAGASCAEEWLGVKDAVLLMFELSDCGQWITSHRLLEERRKSLQLTQTRRDAAKHNRSKLPANAEQVRSKPTANAPQGLGLRVKEDPKIKATPPSGDVPDWIPLPKWDSYVEMRKKIRAPLTEAAKTIAINTLAKLRAAGHDPCAVLDQSTMHSWRGLFEPKGNGNAGKDAVEKTISKLVRREAEGIAAKVAAAGDE